MSNDEDLSELFLSSFRAHFPMGGTRKEYEQAFAQALRVLPRKLDKQETEVVLSTLEPVRDLLFGDI